APAPLPPLRPVPLAAAARPAGAAPARPGTDGPRPPQRPADPAHRLPVAAAGGYPHRARLLRPLPRPVRVRPLLHGFHGHRRPPGRASARPHPGPAHLAGHRPVRTHRTQARPPPRPPHLQAGLDRRPPGGDAMNTGFSGNALAMSLVGFSAVATVTLLLCVMTGPDRDDLDEFYTGYGSLSPFRNGLAIAGDYISAATVLGTSGIIALFGYDGTVLALSTALSLMLLMFLLAEPLRNAGRFTMGDALTRRMPGRGIRITACAVTLAALLPLMVVQLAGTGQLLAFILGFSGDSLQTGCIIGVGALMISYAAIGGMKGTALIQFLKMVLLLGSRLVVAALILHRFYSSPAALFGATAERSGAADAFLSSRLQITATPHPRLDMISSHLTVVLGGACLPHVTMRMYTASSARQVRRSMTWAVSTVALFVLVLTVVGFGATAMIGRETIAGVDPQGNTAYLLGSQAAFGAEVSTAETFLFTTVTTAVFLTLLAS